MPDYTPNEIVDIILVLGECRGNYVQAAELYRNRFPNVRHPNDRTIARLVERQRQSLSAIFCRWAQTMIQQDPEFFHYVLFSDEATFHNTGQLNRHNCHYWSVENPHLHREVNHQQCWSLIV
ncbi:hypothetical protein ALC57_01468 [Trachymyrmex cornetzi]|uniref:DUF4817 domain-containing protein n=1 Tax=Trachymyrmex cornetzi TaxID=471704 RepID=A0A151JPP4_9HYME|nr:hypothetical protein ALC57_01468 [Trachymyrmex cornetzi]